MSFRARSLIRLPLDLPQAMNIAQVPCPGCKRLFNPRGLSQHLSRSRHARCRVVHAALQSLTVFQSVYQPSSPQDAGDDTTFEHDIGNFLFTQMKVSANVF